MISSSYPQTKEIVIDPEKIIRGLGDLFKKKPKSPDPETQPAKSQQTRVDLIASLNDLRDAMLFKIDADIKNTATSFGSVKNYWRAKRWADIARAPLRVLQGTLSILAKASDWSSFNESIKESFDQCESIAEFIGVGMMVNGLRETGGKLFYALNGPHYVSSVDTMLKKADATQFPLSRFDIEQYKKVIENHLNGPENSPLIVLRKMSTPPKKTPEVLNGALQVKKTIMNAYNELIFQIENTPLPVNFPLDKIIVHIKGLKSKILNSTISMTKTKYTILQEDAKTEVELELGVPVTLYSAFGLVSGNLAQDLRVQQAIEWLSLLGTAGNIIQLSFTYKVPGKEAIKIVQQVDTLGKIILSGQKVFQKDPEEEFYMIPQAMLHSLPAELSNLLAVSDGTIHYLRSILSKENLIVTFSAKPEGGSAPLDTTFNANISGTARGPVNYTFWWNCDNPANSVEEVIPTCGNPGDPRVGAKFDAIIENAKTATHRYQEPGIYTAKVIIERENANPVEKRLKLHVSSVIKPSIPMDTYSSPRYPRRLIYPLSEISQVSEQLVYLNEFLNNLMEKCDCQFAKSQCVGGGRKDCQPGPLKVFGDPCGERGKIQEKQLEIRGKIDQITYLRNLLKIEMETGLKRELETLRPEVGQELKSNLEKIINESEKIISLCEANRKLPTNCSTEGCSPICESSYISSFKSPEEERIEFLKIKAGVSLDNLKIGQIRIENINLSLPEEIQMPKIEDLSITIPSQEVVITFPQTTIAKLQAKKLLDLSSQSVSLSPQLSFPKPLGINLSCPKLPSYSSYQCLATQKEIVEIPPFTDKIELPKTWEYYSSAGECPSQKIGDFPSSMLHCPASPPIAPKISFPKIIIPWIITPNLKVAPHFEMVLPNFKFEDLIIPDIKLCDLDHCKYIFKDFFPFLRFQFPFLSLPSINSSLRLPDLDILFQGIRIKILLPEIKTQIKFPSIVFAMPILSEFNLANLITPEILIPKISLPKPKLFFTLSGIGLSAISNIPVPDSKSTPLQFTPPVYYFSWPAFPSIPEIPFCKDVHAFCRYIKTALNTTTPFS